MLQLTLLGCSLFFQRFWSHCFYLSRTHDFKGTKDIGCLFISSEQHCVLDTFCSLSKCFLYDILISKCVWRSAYVPFPHFSLDGCSRPWQDGGMQLSVGARGGGAAGQQAGGVSSLLRGQTGTLAGESFWAVTNNNTASNYSYTVASFSKRVAFDCIMCPALTVSCFLQ